MPSCSSCPPQTGTYNVAGKKPPVNLKLSEWLDQAGPKKQAADVVVLGFQEIVPLSAGNVIAGDA
jgi:phosphatidylinositol-bisphosphatase